MNPFPHLISIYSIRLSPPTTLGLWCNNAQGAFERSVCRSINWGLAERKPWYIPSVDRYKSGFRLLFEISLQYFSQQLHHIYSIQTQWQVQIRFPPTSRKIFQFFFQTGAFGYLNHMSFTMELSFQVLTVTNTVTSHFHVFNAVDENTNFPSENMNLQFCGSEAWYMPHSNLHSIYWQLQISPLLLLPQLPRSLFRLLILWSKWAQVSVENWEFFFFCMMILPHSYGLPHTTATKKELFSFFGLIKGLQGSSIVCPVCPIMH